MAVLANFQRSGRKKQIENLNNYILCDTKMRRTTSKVKIASSQGGFEIVHQIKGILYIDPIRRGKQILVLKLIPLNRFLTPSLSRKPRSTHWQIESSQ